MDHLLADGFAYVTVLDITEEALGKTRIRLGRAVFHFLTDSADRAVCRRNFKAALIPGDTAIIASFASDGPERRSSLLVQRYSADALRFQLGPRFLFRKLCDEGHMTPAGKLQRFQYSVFEYRPGEG